MKPRIRILLIIAAVFLAAAIAAIIGANIYLNTASFRDRVVADLNTRISGKIAITDHHIFLPTARLTLRGLTITPATGAAATTVDHLTLRLFWPALLWREIRISEVILTKADLALLFNVQDQFLFPGPAASSDQPVAGNHEDIAPWQLRVDHLAMRDTTVRLHRPAKGWTGLVQEMTLDAGGDLLQRTGSVTIKIGRGEFSTPEGSHRLSQTVLDAAYDPRAKNPFSLSIQTDESRLKVQGDVVQETAAIHIRLISDFHLNLDQMVAWVPGLADIKGQADGRLAAEGPLFDPDVTLRLDLEKFAFSGFYTHQATADIALHQRRATLHTLSAEGEWGKLALSGQVDLTPLFAESFRRQTGHPDDITYTLHAAGNDLQPQLLPGPAITVPGRWQLSADLTGSGLSPSKAQGQGELALHLSDKAGSAPATLPADTGFMARLQWRDEIVTLSAVKANVGENTLGVDGHLDLANRQMDIKGSLDLPRVSDLNTLLGIGKLAGGGKLKFQCRGALLQPAVHAELLASDLAFNQWTFGRLLAQASLDAQGVLQISRLVLENQGSLLEGQGRLMFMQSDGRWQADPELAVDISFEHLQTADFGLRQNWSGDLNGGLHLAGLLSKPRADLTLVESQVEWQHLEALAQGKAKWEDGLLSVENLVLTKAQSSLRLQGSIGWKDPATGLWTNDPQLQAALQTDHLDLSEIHNTAAGIVSAKVSVSGPVSGLNGAYELNGRDLRYADQRLGLLSMDGRLADATVFIDHVIAQLVVAPSATEDQIQGSGWYAFDQRFGLSLTAANLNLMHISALQKAYPVDGRLALGLEGSGTIDHPLLSVDLTIRKPQFKNRVWDDFHLQARLDGRELSLDADLTFKVTAAGNLDKGEFAVQAQFEQTDLSPYLALWGGSQWAGSLSGDLTANGNWNQPAQIQGHLNLSEASLLYQGTPLIAVRDMQANIKERMIQVPRTRIQLLDSGYLEIAAAGPIDADLQAEAQGRLPLAALAPFTDMLTDATGEIVLQGKAWGSAENLQWTAEMDLAKVGFVLPVLLQSVSDLNGHIRISPKSLSVSQLAGSIGSGRFTLDGEIALEDMKPSAGRLDLKAQAIPLQWPGAMDLVIGGNLALSGAAQRAMLEGNLELIEGTYYKDVRLNLLSVVTETRRAEPVSDTNEKPVWMQATGLNVTLTHRNPFLVNNNLAKLTIAPDLKAVGTLARPVLSGRAKVLDGEVVYRRKSFRVKRGLIDFVNPYKTEAVLDIVSEAQIRNWLVTLAVSGTPDQLVLKLTSDPPEAHNDILSLILIGRTNAEMIQGEGGGSQTTQQMLAALVSTAWGEDIKKSTGMDILEVETGAGKTEDSPDRIQVTVGKQLSRRLTVKYAVESNNGETLQRAVSEYRFLEHLLASGFQDSTGNYGGELLFRIEF